MAKKCNIPDQIEKLVCAAREARQAAKESIGSDDGGSANLDSVWLKMTGDSGKITSALKQGGLEAGTGDSKGYYHISPPDHQWQGYNRTRQCEAVVKVLTDNGFEAGVKSVVD